MPSSTKAAITLPLKDFLLPITAVNSTCFLSSDKEFLMAIATSALDLIADSNPSRPIASTENLSLLRSK